VRGVWRGVRRGDRVGWGMTLGIECQECGREVAFWLDGETVRPTETCECGAVYELSVTRRE